MGAPTLDEIRQWPAAVGVPEAAQAIGISRSQMYALINLGEAPVKVLSFGKRHRVVTASIIRLLEAA